MGANAGESALEMPSQSQTQLSKTTDKTRLISRKLSDTSSNNQRKVDDEIKRNKPRKTRSNANQTNKGEMKTRHQSRKRRVSPRAMFSNKSDCRPIERQTMAGAMIKFASASKRPYCNILSWPVMVVLVLAAHTFALGDGQSGRQWTGQQVDARLIPQVADNGGPGQHQENVHWLELGAELESDSLHKRTAPLSSADMPAEFRDADSDEATSEQPREQSRLAKLCQQTSSVLASVLPAPFGGHKRSILCQFFGQVHVPGGKRAPVPPSQQHSAPQPQPGLPFGGAQLIASGTAEPDTIAILHQHQQAPVALLATGKHPIQMVLEHQQRQAALAQLARGSNLPIRMPVINPAHLIQPQSQSRQQSSNHFAQDLSGDGPFKAQSPRPSPTKFSAPLVTSPAATQAGSNSSGWRIFNMTLFTAGAQQGSSTTPMAAPITTFQSASTVERQDLKSLKPSSTTAKPTTSANEQATEKQTRVGKRTSDAAQKHDLAMVESRQAPDAGLGDIGLDGVRTIEVTAQNASVSAPQSANQTSSQAVASKQVGTSYTKSDLVQKREELVIASINNLTRIAFGNHLRDTVKVINKLIDQQADLFNGSAKAAEKQQESNLVDPMQASESIGKKHVTDLATPPNKRDKTIMAQINKSRKVKLLDGAKHDHDESLEASKHRKQPAQSPTNPNVRKDKDQRQVFRPAEKKAKAPEVRALTTARKSSPQDGRKESASRFVAREEKPKKAVGGGVATGGRSATTGRSWSRSAVPSASKLELRRLTTVARSLVQQSGESTRRPTSTGKSSRGPPSSRILTEEQDLESAHSIRDLRRDPGRVAAGAASVWVPSGGPVTRQASADKSNSPAMRKLREEFARSPSRTITTPVTTKKTTLAPLTTPSAGASSPKPAQIVSSSATVTQFPWLLPDKTAAIDSDLFGSSSLGVTLVEPRLVASELPKKWTTRRMVTPYGSDQFSSVKLTSDSLNGLGSKIDSLTTLKMAVTRAKAGDAAAPTKSTPLPFSGGLSTQSRWIPSTMFITRPTTTPRPSSTTAQAASSNKTPGSTSARQTTTSTTLKPSSTMEMITSSYGDTSSTISLSDLNEARASETISKFTTHLNEANELAATTKRHFQYPLPQIANTGDFFSAETIASWPEKYQTMMSRSGEAGAEAGQESSKTTSAFETTRRNGESYDFSTKVTPAQTTLARHRLDTATSQTVSDKPVVVLNNTPGITVLPSNHKLSSSTTGSDRSDATTLMMQQTTAHFLSTESPDLHSNMPFSTQAKQSPPYTMIDHLLSSSTSQTSSPEVLNQTTAEPVEAFTRYFGLPSLANRTSQMNSSEFLRPPYHENYDQLTNQFQLSDPTLVLDQGQSRPYVSKKLYEMLMPTNQNFVGFQNPLSRQRLNWSALKYLAQSMLSSGRQSDNSTGSFHGSSNGNTTAYTTPIASQLLAENDQQADNSTRQQFIDLIGNGEHVPLSYYHLGSNESALMRPLMQQQKQDDLMEQQSNSTSGKGIFERASNLLSEMKQMEQKRAAAILAAFRYQVPGPLVRPWDVTSDLQSGRDFSSPLSSSISRFFADRFDGSENKHLSAGQLLNTMKSALFKQKLVGREELEARLNRHASNSPISSKISNWRRDDSLDDIELVPGGNWTSSSSGNSTKRLDDIKYILTQSDALKDGRQNDPTDIKSADLRLVFADDHQVENLTKLKANTSERTEPRDFDSINLSNVPSKESTPSRSGKKSDQQVASNQDLSNEETGQKEAILESSRLVADVIAKSRFSIENDDADRQDAVTFPNTSTKRPIQIAKIKSEDFQNEPSPNVEFSCEGRSAGFYPDIDSSCRTFYHCSNTGHLLTFNCPTTTRFDEKTLKCGPWYEVACDVGRVRIRRY